MVLGLRGKACTIVSNTTAALVMLVTRVVIIILKPQWRYQQDFASVSVQSLKRLVSVAIVLLLCRFRETLELQVSPDSFLGS